MRALAALVASILLAACGHGGEAGCRPGTWLACACADGAPGFRPCGDGACVCGPAFTIEPAAVDFGVVPPGGRTERTFLLRSLVDAEVALGAALAAGSDPAFAIAAAPALLPARGAAELVLAYAPAAPGSHAARLAISGGGSTVEAAASGLAPGLWLACAPDPAVFPDVTPGDVAEAAIVCHVTGAGVDGGERVTVSGLTVRGATFSASFRTPPPDGGLALGESLVIDALHRPQAEGLAQGSLATETSAGPVEVALAGTATALPPCVLRVAPASIDFGWLPPGAAERREVELHNAGTDGPCRVEAVRLAGCPDVVTLPDGPVAEARLGPGERLAIPVAVVAGEEAELACALAFTVPGDEAPDRLVPLHGRTGPGCLTAMPAVLDFGVGLAGCNAAERVARLHNGCTAEVNVVAAQLPAGDEFLFRTVPMFPRALMPGELLEVTVGYRPGGAGVDEGAFRFELAGFPAPVSVPLRGEGVAGAERTDVFDGPHRPQLDLLFVLDNGVGNELVGWALGYGAADLQSVLAFRDFDHHVGVTTTGLVPGGDCPGGVGGGEDGRLVPVDGARPRIVDPGSAPRVLSANFAVGSCHAAPPQGMEAAMRAVLPPLVDAADDPRHPEPADGNVGFLRERAHLRLVFVSHRADASPRTPRAYRDAFLLAKGLDPGLLSIVAVTGPAGAGCAAHGAAAAPGDRLIELAGLDSSGFARSICSFGETELRELVPPRPADDEFCHVLSASPADRDHDGRIDEAAGEIAVQVDGLPWPAVRADGTPAWTLRLPGRHLCFPPDALPPWGAEVQVTYGIACLE